MKETGHNPMIREYNRMKLINNILYRTTTIEDEYKLYMMIWDIQEKTELYLCYETDLTGQECTKIQSPELNNVEDVFDEKLQPIREHR